MTTAMKQEDIFDPIPEGASLRWTWLRFAVAYFLGGIALLLPVATVAAVVLPEPAVVRCFPDMRPYWAIGLVLPAVLTIAGRKGSRSLALASCAGVPLIALALWYSRAIDASRSFGGSIDPATAWESLESGLAWWTGQVVPGIVAGAAACAWVVMRTVKGDGSRRMRRPLAMAVVAAAWSAVSPDAATACTCLGNPDEPAWPALEQAALSSDAVLIGRVMAHVVLAEPAPYNEANVAYVEVEVLDGIKGVAGSVLRVWDSGFGTSCTWDLRSLEEGAIVAFALERNGTRHAEYQEIMKLAIPPDDYLLHGCGEYARKVASEAERGELVRTLRRAP